MKTLLYELELLMIYLNQSTNYIKKHINVLVGTISRTVVFLFLSLIKHNVNMREF